MRFVIGERGLSDTDQRALAAERARFADLEFVSGVRTSGGATCHRQAVRVVPARWARSRGGFLREGGRRLVRRRAAPAPPPLRRAPVPSAYPATCSTTPSCRTNGSIADGRQVRSARCRGMRTGARRVRSAFPFVVGALVVGAGLAHWMRGSRARGVRARRPASPGRSSMTPTPTPT